MMGRRKPTFIDVVAILGIGIVCLPIFLALMPYVEQGRTEARIAQTYHDVRQLRDSHRSTQPPDKLDPETTATKVALPDIDPWGQPYRLVWLDGEQVRVLSSGPDMSFSANGTDNDDIYSDMPTSPLQPIRARRNRQWLIAAAVTVGSWIVLALLYMRFVRATSD